MNGRVVGIIQARMGSTRLPGKVLADLAGHPMLGVEVQRLRAARTLAELVVATSTGCRDDAVAALAAELSAPCFRGSDDDCLDRFHGAALEHEADVVVRLTGDNPFLDGAFVDWIVELFSASEPQADYASSVLSGTFPLGLGVEVFFRDGLEAAWREAPAGPWREHVTPFFYKQPERFRILAPRAPRDLGHIRLTVDAAEDLTLARTVFDHFGRIDFSWEEAVAEIERRPHWRAINRGVTQRAV